MSSIGWVASAYSLSTFSSHVLASSAGSSRHLVTSVNTPRQFSRSKSSVIAPHSSCFTTLPLGRVTSLTFTTACFDAWTMATRPSRVPRGLGGGSVVRPGKNVTMASATNIAPMNGRTARTTSSTGVRNLKLEMNRFKPTGGVRYPISRLSRKITPRWYGLTP